MEKKFLFLDFDGTLVRTKLRETFPKGLWDMEIDLKMIEKVSDFIIENKVKAFSIVSNQGGVELGYSSYEGMMAKINYVSLCISEMVEKKKNAKGVVMEDPYNFNIICPSNDKNNKNRKPNPGMLEEAWSMINFNYDTELEHSTNKYKPLMLMVGDASGYPGQFSNSDKKCAENFGIDYMDVVDFIGEDIQIDIYFKEGESEFQDVKLEKDFIEIGPNPYNVNRIFTISIDREVKSSFSPNEREIFKVGYNIFQKAKGDRIIFEHSKINKI